MKHKIAHSLEAEVARNVAHRAIESYVERFAKYSPQARWDGADRANISFSAKGVSLKGSVQLMPGEFVLDLDVPFLLKPFGGKAIAVIEEQVKHWIGIAERGEL